MGLVRYLVTFPRPGAHLIHVRLEFVAAEGCHLTLPAWTPGSYLIREYARNVRTLRADHRATKVAKDRWQVSAPAGAAVAVDYTIYAHELSVRTAHHDATHAFLHPAQVFLVPEGHAGPFQITLELPPRWTALSLAADPKTQEHHAPGRFTLELPDLDSLYDTPIEAGELTTGVLPAPCEHVRVATWGEPLPEFVRVRLARVVAEVERAWPERPYRSYTYVVHAVGGARGGLEHLHGSVLGVDPEGLAPAIRRVLAGASGPDDEADAGVVDFLELASHELFHAWNVKRLRPRELGPFDYQRENYTRELWVAEGFTSYYDALLVLRSGEVGVGAHLGRLAAAIGRLRDAPGRLVQSVRDASFDAWIKLYRPQDDSPNASVSYYLKGGLVALCLDLWVREAAPEGRSLDDVLALLWRRLPAPLRGASEAAKILEYPGFSLEDLEATIAEIAARPIPDEIRGMWRDAAELDFSRLAQLGLRLGEKPAAPGAIELGFTVQDRGGAPWVEHVFSDTPAELAGLAPGDELVAARACEGTWRRLRSARTARVWEGILPGQPAELLVARRDRLHPLSLVFRPARGAPTLDRLADAEPAARQRFEAWSRRPWSAP